jgi:hypothetical protein
MKNETAAITITAIICITLLAISATHHGIDGKLLSAAFIVISGLGGYHLKDTISNLIHPHPPP